MRIDKVPFSKAVLFPDFLVEVVEVIGNVANYLEGCPACNIEIGDY